MKRRVHEREPGNNLNSNMDGMKTYERLKGKLKKIYQKITKNRLKRESDKDINLD